MIITTKENPIRKDSFLYYQMKLIQLIMMWPVQARGFKRFLVHVYFGICVVSLSMCSIGLMSKVFMTNDLVDRSEAIDIFTLTSSGLFKMLYFAIHHKSMEALVDFADQQFLVKPILGDSELDMRHWMRYCGPLSVLHCILAFVCISFWGFCPILNVCFGFKTLEEMTLPMNVWYPYDFNSGFKFVPLYIFHYFGLISSTHTYMACDGFFFSLIYLVNGQLLIIKETLSRIKDVIPKGKETLDEARHSALKKCIEHHNKILFFLKELDIVFRTMIVVDILHAITSLSFAMFQTSESKGVLEYMKMVLFISYCFIHQYLNSLFGQSLINQQESLMSEIYGVDWTGGSLSFQKSLHIMMTGSVKPVKFSAWRMYFLQYETFVEFCRTMVSFFMVLRTLREQGVITS